eukprot:scaffold1230_cov201-Alexandrium_tamarense.AAC.17
MGGCSSTTTGEGNTDCSAEGRMHQYQYTNAPVREYSYTTPKLFGSSQHVGSPGVSRRNVVAKLRYAVERIELQRIVMETITPSLRRMRTHGLGFVSQVHSGNSTIEIISLYGNEITHSNGASSLSDAMKDHNRLEFACLANCSLGHNVSILSTVAYGCKNTAILSLQSNGIRCSGMAVIADAVAHNPSLTHSVLDDNSIDDCV